MSHAGRGASIARRFVGVVSMLSVAGAGSFTTSGCVGASELRGHIDGLARLADEAEANGARRCAPRELALARAHLRFASVDLDQGEMSKAEAHVALAEPNARAAKDESPPESCGSAPGDRDGDGIPDAADKCPDQPETYNGFQDDDGCPDDADSDGDGVPDSKDQCPLFPEDRDGYLDEDGCPEPDNDLDGVPDGADKCPLEPEDHDGFKDEDGCPDKDNDDDGLEDDADQCPNTAGPKDGPRPGCPTKNSLVVVTAKELRITQQIHFATGKATIQSDSFPILDAVRDVLKDQSKIRLEIQGHTDNKGSPALNKKLSQDRANAVRTYLMQHGIDGARLEAKGYGMTRPTVANDTEPNRALNRRVQFIRTEVGTP